MQSKAPNVAAYLAELPAEAKGDLAKVRRLIRNSVPDAVECMRYGLPAYELGELLCSFAAQRNYLALYLLDPEVVAKFRTRLGKLSSGKGCIRFKRFEELPIETIRMMLGEAALRRRAGTTSGPCDEPTRQTRRRPKGS